MIEREHALAATSVPAPVAENKEPRRRGRFWPFVLGFIVGALALFALALLASLQNISTTDSVNQSVKVLHLRFHPGRRALARVAEPHRGHRPPSLRV
jgi:hypothetical protein